MPPNSNPSSGPLQEAIARRQGALNQQGPGSATPSPLPAAAPSQGPQIMASPQGNIPSNSPTLSEPFNAQEAILKAMSEKLKSQNKIEEHQAGVPEKMPA